MHFHEYDLWARLVRSSSAWKQLPGFSANEVAELVASMGTLYSYICVYHGDPLRRGHPKHRYIEDVHDEPEFTLHDIALGYIDAVLIGPVDRIIVMLAADPRLMAAARSRSFCGPVDDPWIRHVGEVVSRADAHSARIAMEAALL